MGGARGWFLGLGLGRTKEVKTLEIIKGKSIILGAGNYKQAKGWNNGRMLDLN